MPRTQHRLTGLVHATGLRNTFSLWPMCWKSHAAPVTKRNKPGFTITVFKASPLFIKLHCTNTSSAASSSADHFVIIITLICASLACADNLNLKKLHFTSALEHCLFTHSALLALPFFSGQHTISPRSSFCLSRTPLSLNGLMPNHFQMLCLDERQMLRFKGKSNESLKKKEKKKTPKFRFVTALKLPTTKGKDCRWV